MDLTHLGAACKRNQTVFVLRGRLTFLLRVLMLSHVSECPFFLRAEWRFVAWVVTLCLSIYSSMDTWLLWIMLLYQHGCLNIWIPVFSSSGYVLRSSASYGNAVFSFCGPFLWFSTAAAPLHVPSAVPRGSFLHLLTSTSIVLLLPLPLPACLLTVLVLTVVSWHLFMVLIFISLITSTSSWVTASSWQRDLKNSMKLWATHDRS